MIWFRYNLSSFLNMQASINAYPIANKGNKTSKKVYSETVDK